MWWRQGSQERDIATAKALAKEWRESSDWKQTDYDPAAALVDDEEIAAFMADAFETGRCRIHSKALGVVARAKGMTEIARKTGLSR